jgi:hypothetical protein
MGVMQMVRIQLRRDTAANWTSSNPVLRAGEIGIETDTLKFKVGNGTSTWTQITGYANVTPSSLTSSLSAYIESGDLGQPSGPAQLTAGGDLLVPQNEIVMWSAETNTYTTTVTATQPTADRTITLPNATGTVALAENVAALSGATFTGNISLPTQITFEGATADAHETVIAVTDPTSDRVIVFPDVTGNVVTTGDTGTVTNLMLAGSIANDKLSNSAITINGTSTSLGGSRTLGTDDVSEGTTNKYFTDERAQDAIATAIAAGTHTNITITYDDSTNKFTFVGANTYSDENAQDAIGNAVGTGLSYNDSTGAISVDTSTIQARVTNVTDTEIGYLDGVTSAIQTQINAKASSDSPTFTGTATLGGTGDFVINGTSNIRITPAAGSNAYVGTASADNIIATAAGLNLKAPIASPTFTGAVTLPGAPTLDLHAATKAYVDAATSGLNVHASVKAATTANITLSTDLENGDTLDGVTLATGNRVLVKNQTDKTGNGIYVVKTSGTPDRADDYNSAGEVDAGDFIFVEAGTANAKTGYVQTNLITTVGSDNIEFTQFSGAGTYLAGNGLTLTGNSFSINTGTTVDLNTSQTLTNKTLTNPTINSAIITAEGGTPTIHGILLPASHGISFEGATDNAFETILTVVDPTADNLVSLPNATDTLVGKSTTDTLTNKTINANVNTITVTSANVSDFNEAAQDAIGNSVGNGITYTDSTGAISVDTTTIQARVADVSDTEIGYLNGVTSAIQTQLDAKFATANASTTNISEGSNLYFTDERAQDAVGNSVGTGLSYNDTTGAVSVDTATIQARVTDVSDTEIGYLNGVTSGIQTQLDGKVDESLFDAKGDILVASADNTPAKLAVGTNGYLLTANSSATNGVEWAAAPVSLPSQTGNSGKYLTTDGSSATWGTLVVPITTGTATVSANTATTVDTTALSAFTSIEYMVSLKQGSKIRTSKVVVQTDGTSVDMTEFAITETGGTIAGVVVSAAVASTNGVLQVTATDATTTNVTVKFSKVAL